MITNDGSSAKATAPRCGTTPVYLNPLPWPLNVLAESKESNHGVVKIKYNDRMLPAPENGPHGNSIALSLYRLQAYLQLQSHYLKTNCKLICKFNRACLPLQMTNVAFSFTTTSQRTHLTLFATSRAQRHATSQSSTQRPASIGPLGRSFKGERHIRPLQV